MTIPFRIKKLTETAKAPTKENEGDLWDLYADDFCVKSLKDLEEGDEPIGFYNVEHWYDEFDVKKCVMTNSMPENNGYTINPQGRILVKTGISLELPKYYSYPKYLDFPDEISGRYKQNFWWIYEDDLTLNKYKEEHKLLKYAVADIRPRSGLALKHGITVLNTPGTIDNSYRKEIGVILYNAGHEPCTITKGDKIAQMLIRPLYPSKMEIAKDIEDTGRGGYGSTDK